MEKKSPSKLVIVGAGGHGQVIAESARLMGIYDVIEFVDARYPNFKNTLRYKVIGSEEMIPSLMGSGTSFVVGIGDNLIRKRIFDWLDKLGVNIATVVHPSALLSPDAVIGRGSVLFAGVIANIGSDVGENVILNSGCIIEHDAVIKSHSHVAPGGIVAGGACIGESSLLGVNASVLPGIQIGDRCVLGAGCVVTKDVGECNIVGGIPAVILTKKATHEHK